MFTQIKSTFDKISFLQKGFLLLITVLLFSVLNYSWEYSLDYTVHKGDSLWSILDENVFHNSDITKMSIAHIEDSYNNCLCSTEGTIWCNGNSVYNQRNQSVADIKRVNDIYPGDRVIIKDGFISVVSEEFSAFNLFTTKKITLLPLIDNEINNSRTFQVHIANMIYVCLYFFLLLIIVDKRKINPIRFLKFFIPLWLLLFCYLNWLKLLFYWFSLDVFELSFYSSVSLFQDYIFFIVILFLSSLLVYFLDIKRDVYWKDKKYIALLVIAVVLLIYWYSMLDSGKKIYVKDWSRSECVYLDTFNVKSTNYTIVNGKEIYLSWKLILKVDSGPLDYSIIWYNQILVNGKLFFWSEVVASWIELQHIAKIDNYMVVKNKKLFYNDLLLDETDEESLYKNIAPLTLFNKKVYLKWKVIASWIIEEEFYKIKWSPFTRVWTYIFISKSWKSVYNMWSINVVSIESIENLLIINETYIIWEFWLRLKYFEKNAVYLWDRLIKKNVDSFYWIIDDIVIIDWDIYQWENILFSGITISDITYIGQKWWMEPLIFEKWELLDIFKEIKYVRKYYSNEVTIQRYSNDWEIQDSTENPINIEKLNTFWDFIFTSF